MDSFKTCIWVVNNFETWFTYTGPKPIKLNDLILNKNEMIEILFDYYGI